LKREYEIGIRWTAFPLHPETPLEGTTLEELFAGRSVDIKQLVDHLIRTAGELGLPFGKREKTYNSRLAQELGKLAEKEGCGEEFHNAAFRAYFADGMNIGRSAVLVELGASVGLSNEQVRDVLENRTFKDAVDEDWRRSYQAGVTAVPTFMMNGMSIAGAQPYENLVRMMDANGVNKKI
jgi:predicted DsbA family dithiol-disulfide isomerase